MGTINSEIHTTLTMEEVALITSMFHAYEIMFEEYKTREDTLVKARSLVNRLGVQISQYPKNDFVLTKKRKKQILKDKALKRLLVLKDNKPFKLFSSYYGISEWIKKNLDLNDTKELNRYDIKSINKFQRMYCQIILGID